jgi:protein-L-isoaspartate(D-aspartate) O-methyltransferase
MARYVEPRRHTDSDGDALTEKGYAPRSTSDGPAPVMLVHGDGGFGHCEHAPYDRICVTAGCPDVPPPLIDQLAARGRLIAPVLDGTRQRLTLLEKTADGIRPQDRHRVLYVSLRRAYGV